MDILYPVVCCLEWSISQVHGLGYVCAVRQHWSNSLYQSRYSRKSLWLRLASVDQCSPHSSPFCKLLLPISFLYRLLCLSIQFTIVCINMSCRSIGHTCNYIITTHTYNYAIATKVYNYLHYASCKPR